MLTNQSNDNIHRNSLKRKELSLHFSGLFEQSFQQTEQYRSKFTNKYFIEK